MTLVDITSRKRRKSAPYLDSKIAKGHESVKKPKVSNSRKTQTTELQGVAEQVQVYKASSRYRSQRSV